MCDQGDREKRNLGNVDGPSHLEPLIVTQSPLGAIRAVVLQSSEVMETRRRAASV